MASSHLFLSNNMVLFLTDLRHMGLSAARASKLLRSMLHLIILCVRVSLNRFFCPPCDRFPCASRCMPRLMEVTSNISFDSIHYLCSPYNGSFKSHKVT